MRRRLRLTQDRIAATQIGAHLRLRNSSLLQEVERLSRVDRTQLLAVAHKDKPLGTGAIGDTDDLLLVGIGDH